MRHCPQWGAPWSGCSGASSLLSHWPGVMRSSGAGIARRRCATGHATRRELGVETHDDFSSARDCGELLEGAADSAGAV